jgi:AcrR family transcriptional regulator
MTAKVEDRRIQRTRALLLSALLALIVERGYEDVTVQDIVDRANVGRSTFYKHFLDKRELLLTGIAGLQELLMQQAAEPASSAAVSERLLPFSLRLFQHVEGNIRFCRALLGPHSGAIVERRIQQILAALTKEELAACVPSGVVPAVSLDVVVQYTVSAFLGLLRWWMEQPTPCSAEEIDRQFRALSIPAISAALEVGAATMQS